jgi:hypothetical protein
MPARFNSLNLLKILQSLPDNEAGRGHPDRRSDLDTGLHLLRSWQAERLKVTYADLVADSQYRSAALFLLNDIYDPHDYGSREGDIERLHDFLSKVLPDSTLRILDDAIHLYRKTDTLDIKLLRILVDDLGMQEDLDAALYAEGYRACDNYDERLHQIESIVKLFDELVAGSRNPMAGMALRLARKPAYTAGWGELFDFLERGYAATKSLPASSAFIDIIHERETRILNQIFAGHPDPFTI